MHAHDPRHPYLPYWDGPTPDRCCPDSQWPYLGPCPRHWSEPVRLDPPNFSGEPRTAWL